MPNDPLLQLEQKIYKGLTERYNKENKRKKMVKIKVSKHAKIRMRERTDLNHRERLSLFRKALDNGKSVQEIKDEDVKRFLSGKQRVCSKVKLYQNYVFVYSKNKHRLYTMYKLPEELIKKGDEK